MGTGYTNGKAGHFRVATFAPWDEVGNYIREEGEEKGKRQMGERIANVSGSVYE